MPACAAPGLSYTHRAMSYRVTARRPAAVGAAAGLVSSDASHCRQWNRLSKRTSANSARPAPGLVPGGTSRYRLNPCRRQAEASPWLFTIPPGGRGDGAVRTLRVDAAGPTPTFGGSWTSPAGAAPRDSRPNRSRKAVTFTLPGRANSESCR